MDGAALPRTATPSSCPLLATGGETRSMLISASTGRVHSTLSIRTVLGASISTPTVAISAVAATATVDNRFGQCFLQDDFYSYHFISFLCNLKQFKLN